MWSGKGEPMSDTRATVESQVFELWGLDKIPGATRPGIRRAAEVKIRTLRLVAETMIVHLVAESHRSAPRSPRPRK